MPSIVSLRSGELCLDVAPEIGGSIVRFRHGDTPLMREASAEALVAGEATGMASFPLVPMSNRIAFARFAFGGEEHRLTRNFGDNPHHLHGFGWRSSWRVASAREDRVTLALDHDPAGEGARIWPYALSAELTYALSGDTLTMSLAVVNRDARPMPAGLGFHPYFPRRPGATLRFRAEGVWIPDDAELPDHREVAQGAFDFRAAKPVADVTLDHAFLGFAGRAAITFPDLKLALALEADPIFSHAVVFVPPGKDFFCVEPVSNMTDAVNRMAAEPDHGLRILAPHERLEGSAGLKVERLP